MFSGMLLMQRTAVERRESALWGFEMREEAMVVVVCVFLRGFSVCFCSLGRQGRC